MVKRGLNPLAPVFIPGSSARQAVSKQPNDSCPPTDNRGFGQLPDAVSVSLLLLLSTQTETGLTFSAAPQVLATVLSCLEQPKDVLACAAASCHMKDIAEHAPLKLCILAAPKLGEEVSKLPLILQSITRHLKGKHAHASSFNAACYSGVCNMCRCSHPGPQQHNGG